MEPTVFDHCDDDGCISHTYFYVDGEEENVKQLPNTNSLSEFQENKFSHSDCDILVIHYFSSKYTHRSTSIQNRLRKVT